MFICAARAAISSTPGQLVGEGWASCSGTDLCAASKHNLEEWLCVR